MRKSGVITLLVIIGVILGISYILTDKFFETLFEDIGTDMVGAKVEIDGFDFSLLGPEIRWQRLQVTNPNNTMTNMLETAKCDFNMEFWPLLSGKFVIENFELSGLASNTKRETDGKIEKKVVKKEKKTVQETESDSAIVKTQKKLKKEKEEAAGFSIASLGSINTDSVIAMLNIRTPHLIDSAQQDLQKKYKAWEEKLASADPQSDVNKIQKQISSIDVKKINSVKSFENALSSVQTVKGSIDSLNKSFKSTKNQFSNDYKTSGNLLGNVDDWIKQDYKLAMSMAKLPDLSVQNIGKMLFGEQIVNQLNEYLGYIGTARGYLNKVKSKNKKDPAPPRFKGQDIYFPTPNARPKFWLQNMTIAGYLSEELPLGGSVTNITTDPKMIGKPVDINIKGSSKSRSYGFDGELNYLDSIPKEMFSANYKGLSLAGMNLSKSELFPESIKDGSGIFEINFNMTGDRLDGKIAFSSTDVSFNYTKEKPSGKMASLIRDVFNQTKELKISAQIKGKADDLVFSVKSNLDDALSKAFKATVNKEIEEAKQKIRKKIDDQVASKKADAEKLIEENKAKLETQLNKYQAKIDEQTKSLDNKKKEIEAQKDKLGDDVKKKLKDSVKNLF